MDDRTAALVEQIRRLPLEDFEARTPRATRVYRGVPLFRYAVATGLLPEDGGSAIERGYFAVSADDGARAALSVAELAPRVSDRHVFLAVEQDGEPLNVGVRLVVPRDGSRSLVGLTDIALREAQPAEAPALSDPELRIGGLLPRPTTRDLTTALPDATIEVETVPASSHGETVLSRHYSGVPVHRLLGDAGMYASVDGEDLHQKIVVATGRDGHVAVIAAGEFGPQFNATPAIAAITRDAAPLDAREGPIRLVVPYDKLAARWVQHLISLELREA